MRGFSFYSEHESVSCNPKVNWSAKSWAKSININNISQEDYQLYITRKIGNNYYKIEKVIYHKKPISKRRKN